MKKKSLLLSAAALSCFGFLSSATPVAQPATQSDLKIGVINFRYCLENSKFGKEELARLETVKKQLESAMQAKEKEINELAPKFNEEYMDTLTPAAEEELKARFSSLNQEFSQLQSQFYNLLNQAQYQIMGKLTEMISNASAPVAKRKGLVITINQEACSYHDESLDISPSVTEEMDAQFAKELAKAEQAKAAPAAIPAK